MEPHRPTISVVCPAYNSAAFIAETLRCVFAQTLPPYECIVADDGSSDTTAAIAEALAEGAPTRVRVLRNPHRGPGAARNAAIRAATGDWIAFLDSDDMWDPVKVERVTAAMLAHPACNFFCHNQRHQRRDGSTVVLDLAARYAHIPIQQQLFRNCPFATSAVVCRRDLLLNHGCFDENLMSAQDYELWLRLGPALRVYFIPEVLGLYRDRSGNISSSRRLRHLGNVLWALTGHRRSTSRTRYLLGVLRHLVAFGKHQAAAVRLRVR